MKFKYLFLALLIGISLTPITPALAQDSEMNDFSDSKKKKISGAVVGLSFNANQYDPSALESVLSQNGFNNMDEDFLFAWGFKSDVLIRNFVLQYQFHGSTGPDINSPDQTANFGYRTNNFGLGYNIFSRKGFLLYPTAQLGIHNLELVVSQNDPETDFDDVVQGDYNHTTLNSQTLSAGVNLSALYMFGFDESSGAGLSIGLDVGYHFQFSDGEWGNGNASLLPSPVVDMGGLVAGISLNFAGWGRQ